MHRQVQYRGGARVSGFPRFRRGLLQPAVWATWPFATLTATDETIRLFILGRGYPLARNAIRELSQISGFPSAGLRIVHTMPDYPSRMVFWTFNIAALKRDLQNLSYEVS
jgi:hypothetical protein